MPQPASDCDARAAVRKLSAAVSANPRATTIPSAENGDLHERPGESRHDIGERQSLVCEIAHRERAEPQLLRERDVVEMIV